MTCSWEAAVSGCRSERAVNCIASSSERIKEVLPSSEDFAVPWAHLAREERLGACSSTLPRVARACLCISNVSVTFRCAFLTMGMHLDILFERASAPSSPASNLQCLMFVQLHFAKARRWLVPTPASLVDWSLILSSPRQAPAHLCVLAAASTQSEAAL